MPESNAKENLYLGLTESFKVNKNTYIFGESVKSKANSKYLYKRYLDYGNRSQTLKFFINIGSMLPSGWF
jgi:hypothetical protein